MAGPRREQAQVSTSTPETAELREPPRDFGSNSERLATLNLVPTERDTTFAQRIETNRWWDDLDPPLAAARATVTTERSAGRGDSAPAVAALGVLANDPAWPALATAESRIVLGREQSPLQIPLWIRTIRALPTDARSGYERLLAASRIASTLAVYLEQAAVTVATTTEGDVDRIAAFRAFRTAGQPGHPSAVEALRTLFSHGWDEVRIEAAVLSRDPATIDVGALDPLVRQAYADARVRTVSTTPRTTTPTSSTTPTEDRSGGGIGGGGAELGRWPLPSTVLDGVPDAEKNSTVAATLLVLAGVDPALARWIATADPATVLPLSTAKDPKPQTSGGYQGYAIRSSDGTLWTAADFTRAASGGSFELGLTRSFFETWIRPLMDDAGMLAMARADLQAEALDAEIARRMAESGLKLDDLTSGRPDLTWLGPAGLEIRALMRQRDQYATVARDLRTGKTSYTALLGQQLDLEKQLDRALADTDEQLRVAEQAWRDRVAAIESDKAIRAKVETWEDRRYTRLALNADDEARKVTELREWRAVLQTQKDGLSRVLASPYAVVPPADLTRMSERVKQGYTFTSTPEAVGLAARAGLVESWAMVGRVYGGLARYGVPLASQALGFDDHGVGEELARRAFARVEALERGAAEDTAEAEKVLGSFGTEVVKLLTVTAVTALPTLGVGAGGAAIGGAIRGGVWGARIGASLALGTLGALQNSGRGAGAMSFGALSMGLMPLAGSLGSTGATRLVAAFVGNALLDGAGSVDVAKAVDAWVGGRSLDDAVRIAVANVSVQRMVLNGVVGLLTEAVAIQVETAGGKTPLVVDRSGAEPRYYRIEGATCVDVPSPSAELAKGAVEVSTQELAALKAGSTEVARSAIGRNDTLNGLREVLGETDARIAQLRSRGGSGAELGDLAARRATTQAQIRVLEASRGGGLTDDLVRDAGGAPEGWVRDESGGWTWRREVAEQAVRARTEQLALARSYREAVAETDTAWKALSALRKRGAADAAITEARARLDSTAETARTRLDALKAASSGIPELDVSLKIGAGGEGTVYALNDAVAVKLPKDGTPVENLLRGVIPTRYGGLGTGEIVTVRLEGVETRGVAMRRVTGQELAKAGSATESQLRTFEEAMANVKSDGFVLSDLHGANILLTSDGGLVVVDAPVVDRATFGAAMRKVVGDVPQSDIDAAWEQARTRFDASVEAQRQRLRELIAQSR